MDNRKNMFAVIALAVLAAYGSYMYGVNAGKEQARAEIKTAQAALAEKAAEGAAKAANPFQTGANPLAGVVDPLTKAKKVLNPFE